MSIIWNTLLVSLADLIQAQTGLTTIILEQSSPQPSAPYIAIKIISGPTSVGQDELRYDNSLDSFILEGQRVFTLSIQSYGKGGIQALSDFLLRLNTPSVGDKLKNIGVGITNFPSVTNLSSFLDTTFEERGSIDIIFSAVDDLAVDTAWIERVAGEGDVDSFIFPYDTGV